jgi:hypothetical protein
MCDTRLEELTAELLDQVYGYAYIADDPEKWKTAFKAKIAEVFRLGMDAGHTKATAIDADAVRAFVMGRKDAVPVRRCAIHGDPNGDGHTCLACDGGVF